MNRQIIILFLFIIYSLNAIAEDKTVKFSGYIKDIDKKPLEYVNVTIDELGMYTATNSEGYFEFSNVPPGKYHFTFKRTGYNSRTIELTLTNDLLNDDISLDRTLIETATIDVTGSFEAQDVSNSTLSVTTISDRNLVRSRDQILGTTISKLPGVNVLTTGIGIGKPVIRGLSSTGVIVVHDGVKHESQQWGDEHAPEVSIYDIDKIEILRGPSSLLYGSEGLGGVVNIISKPLLFSDKQKPVYYGGLDIGGFSVNNQATGNVTLGMGLRNIGFKGHFGYRNSGNVRTPDGNLLINTLTAGIKDTIFGGKLSNSGSKELQGGLSFGLNGNFGSISAGFETFNREIQMHDPDPSATSNQRINTNQFELSGDIKISAKFHFEPIFSYQQNFRKEFDNTADKELGITASDWRLRTFQTDLKLHNHLSNNFEGTFGVSSSRSTNESLGKNKLIPNFQSTGFGVFAMEKYNKEKWSLSLGGRFDTKKLDINTTVFDTLKTINSQSLNFNAFSGSAGVVFRPVRNIDIYTNLGRGWRAPSEFELFVDGVHEGSGRVERGLITQNSNADIPPEASVNFDIGVRTRFNNITLDASYFFNTINNFIYPSPTNIIDPVSGFPVYNIKQDKATFTGVEYTLQYQPFEFLLLSLNGDYVKTENKATGYALPFTPPAKNIIEIKFQRNTLGKFYNPYLSFSAKIVSAQNSVDPFETKTEGYVLLNSGLGFDFILSKTVTTLDFSVDNIANTKYVDHLSRYKSFAMNPGRSFNLKLSVPFQF